MRRGGPGVARGGRPGQPTNSRLAQCLQPNTDETFGLRLIAVTGWGQEEDRRRTEEAGFDYHMVKPVEPAALESLLAGLLSPR